MTPFRNPFKGSQGGGGKEAQPSGGGLPPTAPETPAQIAAKKLAEEQSKTTSIYRKLMEDMRTSVLENGLFYFELGREPEDGMADNRIIILKEGRSYPKTIEGRFEYAVITNQGAMKLTLDQELYQSKLMEKRMYFKNITSRDIYQGDKMIVQSNLDFGDYGRNELKLSPIGDTDQDFLQEAMTKSIEKARATSENTRIKAGLEAEQKKQTAAIGLSNLFNKAIHPPTGESPTTAPPPSAPLPPTGL